MPEFFAGLDLGQANDFSALAIAEAADVPAGEYEPVPGSHGIEPNGRSRPEMREKTARRYDLRHLERFRLNASYPEVVAAVAALLGREPLASARTTLAIDHTGVGRPVYDMFERVRLRAVLVPVTIHGGDTASRDGRGWRTPKRELIAVTQVLLQSARLRIAPALAEADTLVRELADYRVKISASGHDTYSAREGQHDDLVLAVALAVWTAERGQPRRWGLVG